jgi:hypothetical protein
VQQKEQEKQGGGREEEKKRTTCRRKEYAKSQKYSETAELPEMSQSATLFFMFCTSCSSLPSSKRPVRFIVLSSETDSFAGYFPLSKGPNRVGVFLLAPEDGIRPSFRNVVFCSLQNSGRWTKSRTPKILRKLSCSLFTESDGNCDATGWKLFQELLYNYINCYETQIMNQKIIVVFTVVL